MPQPKRPPDTWEPENIYSLTGAEIDELVSQAVQAEREKRKAAERQLAEARIVLKGLMCVGCKAQGAEMAKRCCRDVDCDAAWFGIDVDAIAEALADTKTTKGEER